MSAKTGSQAGRRTSLSLTAATAKQNQQQQLQRTIGNLNDTTSRNDTRTSSSNQKSDQTVVTVQANSKTTKQSNIADKRNQQQATKIPTIIEKSSLSLSLKKSERNDEKKTQNGVGSGNSSTNINVEKQEKEKQQHNGKEANGTETVKDKKDNKVEKMERTEKTEANLEKKEKLEKELQKKKELEKEKEQAKLQEEVKQKEKEEEKEQEKQRKEEEKRQKEKEKKMEEENELVEKEAAKVYEKKPEKETRLKRTCVVEASETNSPQGKQDIEKKMSQEKQDAEMKIQQENQDIEKMDISVGKDESQTETPTSTSRNVAESTDSTPSKEPLVESAAIKVTPQKTTQSTAWSSNMSINTQNTVTTKSVTTTIDDDEMDALPVVETTPKKDQPCEEMQPPSSVVVAPKEIQPKATSTPGKYLTLKEIFSTHDPSKVSEENPPIGTQSVDRCAFRPSQISGRRSIRPTYEPNAPLYFQNNTAYRESYRRINTELDVSSTTNTSLNVTVGSEVPNNSSFSFFGRGRKRERTPPKLTKQSTIELDVETTSKSPKRARTEKYGFFSVVASPLSLLRSRFSKTSIQSSTPMKSQSLSNKMSAALAAEEDDGEVQNVSGVSVEENANLSITEQDTVGNKAAEKEVSRSLTPAENVSGVDIEVMESEDENAMEEKLKLNKSDTEKPIDALCDVELNSDEHDKDISSGTVNVETCEGVSKKNRCSVM